MDNGGKPRTSAARQRLWVYGWPVAVRLAVFAVAAFIAFPLLRAALLGPDPVPLASSLRLLLVTVLPPVALAAWWQQWRHERLAARPELEPALNQRAIDWLHSHDDFDRVKLEGEMARETVYLPGWTRRWLLVTNRRVLLFVASDRERRLVSEWPRRGIVFAGAPQDLPPGARRPTWLRLLLRAPNLALAFTTGTVLELQCASTSAARRVAQLLMSSPAIPDDGVVIPALFAGDRASRR